MKHTHTHTHTQQANKQQNIPDQVLTTNTRCFDSSTDQRRSCQPNAPRSTHNGQAKAKGNAKARPTVRAHVRKDFRPTRIAVFCCTNRRFYHCVFLLYIISRIDVEYIYREREKEETNTRTATSSSLIDDDASLPSRSRKLCAALRRLMSVRLCSAMQALSMIHMDIFMIVDSFIRNDLSGAHEIPFLSRSSPSREGSLIGLSVFTPMLHSNNKTCRRQHFFVVEVNRSITNEETAESEQTNFDYSTALVSIVTRTSNFAFDQTKAQAVRSKYTYWTSKSNLS